MLDRTGNIYLNGYFDGTSDFNPGTGVFNMTSGGSTDIYICKLNAAGNFLARRVGGSLSEGAYSIGPMRRIMYTAPVFLEHSRFRSGVRCFDLVSNGFGDGFLPNSVQAAIS